MSYCLKNVPGTYDICGLSSGHKGPCSGGSSVMVEIAEKVATRLLESYSDDRLVTDPAVKDFHTRRAMGESVESAYRGALEFMIRRVG